ncbi:MAG: PAS domain-containing protein [Promethearchaeota archaeon]
MSDVGNNELFFTKLRNETFLRLADTSIMGITLIRRGYLKYFNKKFEEIFGYSRNEILSWKKFEYFKIIHPEDIPQLLQKIKIEDNKNAILQFRGVRKEGEIIPIENYIYRIKYDNKYMYFSSYVQLDKFFEELYIPKIIKTKEEREIMLNYSPDIIRLLEDNSIDFEVIKHYSYREE